MTHVALVMGGWTSMDIRMMRELARQISGIDAIPASIAGPGPGIAPTGRAPEESPQPEPASSSR